MSVGSDEVGSGEAAESSFFMSQNGRNGKASRASGGKMNIRNRSKPLKKRPEDSSLSSISSMSLRNKFLILNFLRHSNSSYRLSA